MAATTFDDGRDAGVVLQALGGGEAGSIGAEGGDEAGGEGVAAPEGTHDGVVGVGFGELFDSRS